MPEEREEYELIPISPLRKLEKRIEELEARKAAIDIKEFLKEIVDIVKMNQSLVNELVKANDALRIELSKLPGKIEEVTKSINELIGYIKAAAVEELPTTAPGVPPETLKAMVEKMGEISKRDKKIAELMQAVASTLEELERRLRKPPAPPTARIRRPPLPPPKKVV